LGLQEIARALILVLVESYHAGIPKRGGEEPIHDLQQ
jgi:hypothetical protein